MAMLHVKAVAREEIDRWSLVESGLPARVVNSARAAKVQTVGELRTWSDADLLSLRSLGRISLQHVRSFFTLCDNIERGQQSFQNMREVLDIFLDRDEFIVISLRYGFERETTVASRKYMTLQEIGNQEHKTRERIRQIEETAKARLQSRLGSVCLQPFYDYFARLLETVGRTAPGIEIAPLADRLLLNAYNPCSILLLLCDVNPRLLTFRNGFFSTLEASKLEEIERRALEFLGTQISPVPLDAIMPRLTDVPGFGDPASTAKTVAVTLAHCPPVAATADRRYFLYSRGMNAFLVEVMKQLDLPAHFRAITQAVNDGLEPQCRKGAGYVLETLNAHPQCTRIDRGIYGLRSDT